MSKNINLQPPLIWVGSKTWCAQEIWRLYYRACVERNTDLRFVDPFCGSLALPFHIGCERVWANDLNPHLINFYSYIQEYGTMPDFSAKNTKEDYLEIRKEFNAVIYDNNEGGDHDIFSDEMAEMFYFLNRSCYGGLSRYNKRGGFNVPYRGKTIGAKTDFSLHKQVMKNWEFSCLDYSEVLKDINSDDFIYLDPPYEDTFDKYTPGGFGFQEQMKLVSIVSNLKNPIVAANNPTETILNLYKEAGFDVHFRKRTNSLQNARDVKKSDFKEAIFTKNIKLEEVNV